MAIGGAASLALPTVAEVKKQREAAHRVRKVAPRRGFGGKTGGFGGKRSAAERAAAAAASSSTLDEQHVNEAAVEGTRSNGTSNFATMSSSSGAPCFGFEAKSRFETINQTIAASSREAELHERAIEATRTSSTRLVAGTGGGFINTMALKLKAQRRAQETRGEAEEEDAKRRVGPTSLAAAAAVARATQERPKNGHDRQLQLQTEALGRRVAGEREASSGPPKMVLNFHQDDALNMQLRAAREQSSMREAYKPPSEFQFREEFDAKFAGKPEFLTHFAKHEEADLKHGLDLRPRCMVEEEEKKKKLEAEARDRKLGRFDVYIAPKDANHFMDGSAVEKLPLDPFPQRASEVDFVEKKTRELLSGEEEKVMQLYFRPLGTHDRKAIAE